MKEPEIPPDEAERLAQLAGLGVMDTPPEQVYDDSVRIAARVFGVPIALVSLVDAERQWFKARIGLDAPETPRTVSFCGHAVADGQTLVVPDAHLDPRFRDNPLVAGDPNVRFYAGAPLTTSDGHTLGTLCVIDHEAREPSAEQLESLERLARHVTSHLELRRRSAQAAFFDMTLDMLCIAGMDGFFKLLNPAWTRVLGWSESELLSKPFIEFVHPEDQEATIVEAGKLALGGYETTTFVNRYECRDGSYRWLDWTAAPDATGQLLHAVAHDVTEKRRVEQMKNEFVSVVSHELRTPLTSIRGSLRLLEGGVGGDVPDKARGLIKIASKNTDRLVRLINDILDLEKIEAGKMELSLHATSAREVLEQSLDAMRGLASHEGITLTLDAPTEGLGIDADSDRLVQVLSNLLSNAIKFSPAEGEVRVTARGVEGHARFSVIDQGPGIPEAHQQSVFGKFTQVDSSDTRATGGTGLGLAIVKAIVEQHGGRLGLDSQAGAGSTFWFELPLRVEVSALPAGLPAGEDSLRHSVLIVEDDPDVVHILRLLITGQGYRARWASSVAMAKEALATEVPDAVLLDLTLADRSGVELVAWMRDHARLVRVPVIVMTGRERGSTDFGDAILVDWLQKPIDESQLTHALRSAVRQPGPVRVLVAEDDADARTVLVALLQQLGAVTFEASDGQSAIEQARRHLPDLIVLDVGLPGADGFDVVDALKQTKTRATPLVVYTGRELNRGERAALQLGLTRHLTKARTTEGEFSNAVVELLNGALGLPQRGARD